MKTALFLLALLTTRSVSGFQPLHRSSQFYRAARRQTPFIRVSEAAEASSLFVASPASPDDPTVWTKKRLHNTAAFRSVAILGALALTGFSSSGSLPTQAAASVHVLSFATWFGSVAYTTFIAGITMFKNLPRQTFGKLQGKLFPKYFMLGSVTLLLQLITLPSLVAIKVASTKALGLALAMNLLNQFYLEPASTNNMMRRYELEEQKETDTDEYKSLKAQFGKFHGLSSLTNLVAMCGGVAHAVYLAGSLTP